MKTPTEVRATEGSKRRLYADAPSNLDQLPEYFASYFDTLPTSVTTASELVPPDARRVLDVGCALGKTGRLLKNRRDIEVVGIELIEEAARVAERHLDDVLRLDLDEQQALPYPPGHFDAILLLDVIEHLLLPSEVVGHLLHWLRPQGTVIFSVPNVTHISVLAPLLGPAVRFQDTSTITSAPHLRFFTLGDLVDLLTSNGLRVDGTAVGVGTQPDADESVIGDLAAALGGDRQAAIFESRVVQWVLRATRSSEVGSTAGNGAFALEWRSNQQLEPSALGLDWS